jgi:hypothetical protein
MTLNDPGAKKEPDSCNLFVFQGGIFQNALKKVEMRKEAESPWGKGREAATTSRNKNSLCARPQYDI